MQIKNNLLHIFPIEIWLEEGNMHYCHALGIALKCSGKFNLEIQTQTYCNSAEIKLQQRHYDINKTIFQNIKLA